MVERAKSSELRLSPRVIDSAVKRGLVLVDILEDNRPDRLGTAAPIMAEIYSIAGRAGKQSGPTSGQIGAIEKLVAQLERLKS